jgi:hypothetical protein
MCILALDYTVATPIQRLIGVESSTRLLEFSVTVPAIASVPKGSSLIPAILAGGVAQQNRSHTTATTYRLVAVGNTCSSDAGLDTHVSQVSQWLGSYAHDFRRAFVATVSEIDTICAVHVSNETADQWGMFAIPISRGIDSGAAKGFALSAAHVCGSSCRVAGAAFLLV